MVKRKKVIQRDPRGFELSTFEEEEEDETEDGLAIIPDGGRVRVRLDMMDSLQKAVAQDKVNIDSGPMIVDAFGRGDRYSLSKPGARYLSANPSTTDHAELGRGLINAQPQPYGCKLNKCEIVGRELVVARCHTTAMFDLVEEPFDQVAGSI